MTAQLVNDMMAAAKRAKSSTTKQELGRLYEDLVGYDLSVEDPDASIDSLRQQCVDYIKVVCAEYGIHLDMVGIEDGSE